MSTKSILLAVAACFLSVSSAAALDVTLDAGGAGSVTLSDTDMDHIVDFDETVGGVFRARGRVLESIGPITTMVTLTSTPPDTEGIFGKLGVGTGTVAFTVTINTSAMPATGSPLGWRVNYVGKADDAMAGIVEIPSHSLAASVNAASVPLTTLNGSPILAPTTIDLFDAGVNPLDTASDLTVVFSFTPGPDDEIRMPDNNGFDNKSIEVSVFNQQEACVDKMNNDARRVALLAGNGDAKCVKKGRGTDVTACVDDPNDFKTDQREQKLLSDFANNCVLVPAWGVNGATCCESGPNDGATCAGPADCTGGACIGGACISAAAEDAAGLITHDVFGASVAVSADKKAAACQAKVIQRTEKLYTARWKTFRKCKKDNFMLISGDADLINICLGPPQPDPRGTIGKALGHLADKVQSVCVNKGITPVGAQLPGVCTGAADGALADCVAARVACRFCRAVSIADDISGLDCDAFDGAGVGSCPP